MGTKFKCQIIYTAENMLIIGEGDHWFPEENFSNSGQDDPNYENEITMTYLNKIRFNILCCEIYQNCHTLDEKQWSWQFLE